MPEHDTKFRRVVLNIIACVLVLAVAVAVPAAVQWVFPIWSGWFELWEGYWDYFTWIPRLFGG